MIRFLIHQRPPLCPYEHLRVQQIVYRLNRLDRLRQQARQGSHGENQRSVQPVLVPKQDQAHAQGERGQYTADNAASG
jgi:hypothetical protein